MSFDGLRLQATGPRRAVLLLALLCFVAFREQRFFAPRYNGNAKP